MKNVLQRLLGRPASPSPRLDQARRKRAVERILREEGVSKAARVRVASRILAEVLDETEPR